MNEPGTRPVMTTPDPQERDSSGDGGSSDGDTQPDDTGESGTLEDREDVETREPRR